MDDRLNKQLEILDEKLKDLGEADSAVEYAPHIREPFNEVLNELNKLKELLGINKKDDDWYFL